MLSMSYESLNATLNEVNAEIQYQITYHIADLYTAIYCHQWDEAMVLANEIMAEVDDEEAVIYTKLESLKLFIEDGNESYAKESVDRMQTEQKKDFNKAVIRVLKNRGIL